jgi:hypothetical protein
MNIFYNWFYSKKHWCGFVIDEHIELGVNGEMYLSDDVYCGGWDNPEIPPDNIRRLAPEKFKKYYDFVENNQDIESTDTAFTLYYDAFKEINEPL